MTHPLSSISSDYFSQPYLARHSPLQRPRSNYSVVLPEYLKKQCPLRAIPDKIYHIVKWIFEKLTSIFTKKDDKKIKNIQALKDNLKPLAERTLSSSATLEPRPMGKLCNATQTLIKKTLENKKARENLSDLVRDMLEANSDKVTGILITRINELLSKTDFPSAFDSTASIIGNHIDLLVKAEKAKRKTERIEPENAETNRLKQYASEKFCFPRMAELIDREDLTEDEKAAIEKDFFDDATEQLLSILFPNQIVKLPNGEIKTVDGFVWFCKELVLTDEVKSRIQKYIGMTGDELSSDALEALCLSMIKKHSREFVSGTLQKALDHLISPVKLNKIMATKTLPLIRRQLLKTMAKKILQQEASLGNVIIDSKSLNHACATLYNLTLQHCEHFREEFKQISLEEYKKIVLPAIKEFSNDKSPVEMEKNPLYGQLVVDLIRDLGELVPSIGTVWILWPALKDLANETIPEMLNQYHKSPDAMLELLADQFTEYSIQADQFTEYSIQPETIESWFTDSTKSKDGTPAPGSDLSIDEKAVEIKDEKVKAEIAKTSKLLYDLIALKVGQGKVAKFVSQSIIGPDPESLRKTISRIYNRVLGNKEINENLVFRIQTNALRILAGASKNLQIKAAKSPHEIEELPRLLSNELIHPPARQESPVISNPESFDTAPKNIQQTAGMGTHVWNAFKGVQSKAANAANMMDRIFPFGWGSNK